MDDGTSSDVSLADEPLMTQSYSNMRIVVGLHLSTLSGDYVLKIKNHESNVS